MDKELYAAKRKLNKENNKLILKMEQYLESHYINEVAGEEILSDIVGMALECQERSESFLDAIGGDSEAFCRELIRNSPRQSWLERILNVLRWLFFYSACLMPLFCLVELVFPDWSPAELHGLTYTAPLAFLLKYYVFMFVLIIGWFIVRMCTYKPMKYVFGGYFAVFMLFFFFTNAVLSFVVGDRSTSVHLFVVVIAFAALTILCELGRRLTAMTVAYRKRKKENTNHN